ncbi:RHS repeat-associated core domain-containing protein, partial [Thermodesulfobacteriota bacterium]
IEQGYTTDASGQVSSYGYVTSCTYNARGQVLSVDGPLAGSEDTTQFGYDPATGDLVSVTRPVIGTITYWDHDAAGQPGRITDPNGNEVTYAYDGRGRITAVTHEANGATVSYEYDGSGHLVGHVNAGVATTFEYDETHGRLSRMLDASGNFILYDHDDQGNRSELSYHAPSGERRYRMRYDYHGPAQPGRLWRVITPDDTYTEYSYDARGNVNMVTDPAGKVTWYEYSAMNRLVTVTQPGQTQTSYRYDTHGNLVGITDAGGNATPYLYDDLGRLVAAESPDTGSTQYWYDAAGNVAGKTDANGHTVTYSYDALNRLTGVHFADPSQDIVYDYDQGTDGKGRLTGIVDSGGSYVFAYDAVGNPVSQRAGLAGNTFAVSYTYDPSGILTHMTYPSGRVVEYEHDDAGRTSTVTTSRDGTTMLLAGEVTHMPFGPVSGLTYGNGSSLTKGFDQAYRLEGIYSEGIQDVTYGFDPGGNITTLTDHLYPEKSTGYGYDDLYRLTSASALDGAIEYSYDPVGNRLSEQAGGGTDFYEYESGTNRLSRITGATFREFSHDANGNMIAMGSRALVYNQNNRLVEIVDDGVSLGGYTYNALGQRVIKEVGGEKTFYVYDTRGHLIAEMDQDGQVLAEYVYLDDQLLAMFSAAQVEAVLDIDPDVINLRSRKRWIRCTLGLPEEYSVFDIDPATVMLNGTIRAARTAIVFDDEDGVFVTRLTFDRRLLVGMLEPGQALLEVTGQVNGMPFAGEDVVQVVMPGGGRRARVRSAASRQTRSPSAGEKPLRLFFYHLDHLGTPMLMTDENADVVWQAEYQPFGQAHVGASSTATNNIRFPGQYYDNETGLHYNWHRYYDPVTGRYLTPDPIGLAGGDLNLYRYVWNKPTRLFDPWGLWKADVHSGIGNAGYGTYTWAKQVVFSDAAARKIAIANDAVDVGFAGWIPVIGLQSRHFNQMFFIPKRHPEWYDIWHDPRNAGDRGHTEEATTRYFEEFLTAIGGKP